MDIVYSVESKVTIKNEVGTGEKSCTCGPWLGHWEKHSKRKASTCSVDGCTEVATVGAHISRPNAKSDVYKTHPQIVPMCKTHNGKHGAEFVSKANTTFVWANVKETCGN